MLISELLKEDPQDIDAEPTPEDIQAVQQLLGTIDPVKEQPETLLNKLTSWMRSNPLLDKITDIIPQTRIVKAIASAVDAIESGDRTLALSSLAAVVGGNVGKNMATLARGANTATALQQGDLKGAVQAQGGTAAKLANLGTNINRVQTALAPKTAPQPTQVDTTVAQTPDEIERLKQLANV